MPLVRTHDAQQLMEAVIAKYQRESNVFLKEGKQQFFDKLATHLNATNAKGGVTLKADSLYRHYYLKLKRWNRSDISYRLPILDKLSHYAYGLDYEKRFFVITDSSTPPIPNLENIKLLILCDQHAGKQAEQLCHSLMQSGYLQVEVKYRDVLKTDELQPLIQWDHPAFFVINLIDYSYFTSENYLRRAFKMKRIFGEKYLQKILHIILPDFIKVNNDASNFYTLKAQLKTQKYWQDYVEEIESFLKKNELSHLKKSDQTAILRKKEVVEYIRDNIIGLMEQIRSDQGTLPFNLCLSDQGKEKLFAHLRQLQEHAKSELSGISSLAGDYWIYHVFPRKKQLRKSLCEISPYGEIKIKTLSADYKGIILPTSGENSYEFDFYAPLAEGFRVYGTCHREAEGNMMGNFLLGDALEKEAGMKDGKLYFEYQTARKGEYERGSLDLDGKEYHRVKQLPGFEAFFRDEIKKIQPEQESTLALGF